MASSIAGARVALYDLLAAAAPVSATQAPDKVQVTFGDPVGYVDQEVISLLDVEDADEEFAALGAQRRAETFVLVVAIKVYDPAADTGQAVDARWYALYDVVRGVVSANPTFAPDSILPAEVLGTSSIGPYPKYAFTPSDGSGWLCVQSLRIRCQTRIT